MSATLVDRGRQRRGIVAVLTFDAFCAATLSGFGTPLIPEMARVHEVSFEAAQWILTVTLIVGAVTVPVLSRVADGRRKHLMLVVTLVVVGLGAPVAALVPTFVGMLVGRALQGLGYGLVPLTISLACEHLDGVVLRRTLAVLSVSVAVGVGLANPLTGAFVLLVDYRAAFLAGAVLCLAGAAATIRVVPSTADATDPVGLDVLGALTLAGGLAAGLLAVSRGESWGWTSPRVVGLGVAGALLLAAWVVVELRADAPLVDLRLATSRALIGVNLTALTTGASVFGGMSVVYRILQAPVGAGGLGQALIVAGSMIVPMSVGSLLAPPLARVALRRGVPVAAVLAAGGALDGGAFLLLALARSELWLVGVVTFVAGLGIGVAYSVMPAVIVAATPPRRTASATGLNTVLRISGGAVGSAVLAAVQAAWTPPGATFPDPAGYTAAALVAVALCAVAVLVSALTVRSVRAAPVEEGAATSTWDLPVRVSRFQGR